MATKNKKQANKKDAGKGHNAELEDLTYKDLMSDELFTQWQVNNYLVNYLVDRSFDIVQDKEIKKQVPWFTTISTMSILHKIFDMRELAIDQRIDDCHLSASDADEFLPPPDDNIGRKSKVND